MPEYLAPGVYVEEVPSGNKPIEGVSTSTAAFIGVTQRGPVNEPTLVTSLKQYTSLFGSALDSRVFQGGLDVLPYAVQGFFENGGARVYITRITGPDATNASIDLFGIPADNSADTSLTDRAAAGATTLLIDSGTNIATGDTLLLLGGTRSEYVLAVSDPIATGIRLLGSLHTDHAADEVAIQDETLGADVTVSGSMVAGATTLAIDPTGLVADQVLRVRDTGDPNLTEYVTIQTAGAAAIKEAGGLLFAHSAATTEVNQVTLADAAGEPGGRTVQVGADAGDFMIPLTNTTSLDADQVVRIGTDEYYVVQNVVSSLSIASTPTQEIHTSGTEVIKQQPLLSVIARYPGAWGNSLRITVKPSSALQTTVEDAAATGDSPIHLKTTFGLGPGSVILIARGSAASFVLRQRVAAVDYTTNEVSLTGGADADLQVGDMVASLEYSLVVERLDENNKVVESEFFNNLGADSEHLRYGPRIVGSYDRATGRSSSTGESELVRLDDLSYDDTGVDVTGADDLRLTVPYSGIARILTGGTDDLTNITDQTFIGSPADDPEDRTGIYTFENEDDISLVAAPGRTSQDVQNTLITHCENMRYRFAILDSINAAKMKDVQTQRSLYDTTRAALYYPWLIIGDRFSKNGGVLYIPSSGHVAGIYARSDIERGVHKAPANEVVRGIRGLQVRLSKGEQDILNPRHINCIRDFSENNRGLRVWGARTLSSDPEWKYVNVRRLFLFVEKSIERGLQWAVFEPNAEPLWATVKRSISDFLVSVWRSGALEGTKQEEAFFVNVGLNTMTQNDIDNGRLIVIVGIAPVKPAEFVIIRISQKTREATA